MNHESFDLVTSRSHAAAPRRPRGSHHARKQALQTPVLILTAKDTVDDRVTDCDSGADDYLVKPLCVPRAAGTNPCPPARGRRRIRS